MTSADSLDYARTVADAVLYEGYLLYPYRANSAKNQSRWQFGVLGPVGAADAGHGEDPAMSSQFLVRSADPAAATLAVHLRFLHLQHRRAERASGTGGYQLVPELIVGDRRWLSWDEATECDISRGPWRLDQLVDGRREPIDVPAGEEIEAISDGSDTLAGRLVRQRRALHGHLSVRSEVVDVTTGLVRLTVEVRNVAAHAGGDRDSAIAVSFIGTHLIIAVQQAEVVSMTDPPQDAVAAAGSCCQHRCWPVLAGPSGDTSLMLVSPIILYDHPEVAEQSAGALFDSTEIDEILTLRVMTMTDEEKIAARATDPKAAEIIDRCDAMSQEDMQQLHGILRDPHGFGAEVAWWDSAIDGDVAPETDAVLINGVRVAAGSIVRVCPSRRADAQDLFYAGQQARVTAVHSDVDGETHVAVVLVDDPAADLHEWYGRFLYFAPDELEPLPFAASSTDQREETRS